jgi:hypothetical protein
VTQNSAAETITPAAEPVLYVEDRTVTAKWNVGPADEDGWQSEARLMVSHWPSAKRYDAQLQVSRVKVEDGITSEDLSYSALENKVVIAEQATTKRFSRYTLNAVYENALAELRRRFEDGDDAVTAYFDPTSDTHAA